jgi:hypothetical protein
MGDHRDKPALPPTCLEHGSVSEWLRRTGAAYDKIAADTGNDALRDAAFDLMEVANHAEQVEDAAALGLGLAEEYDRPKKGQTWGEVVFATICEGLDLPGDIAELWQSLLALLGDDGDSDAVLERVRRLMAYRDKLAELLHVEPEELDETPTEDLELVFAQDKEPT